MNTKTLEPIRYSGGDVTKMSLIGRVEVKPIGPFEGCKYDVVEIIKSPKGDDIYICNFWYKEHKRIPQLIHSALVVKYIKK